MDEIFGQLSFGVGRKNAEKVDHPLFDDLRFRQHVLGDTALKIAREQLGTIGSGNHYVDLLTDEEERIWIGVHFGSRGLGHKTATHFLNVVGAKDDMDAPPVMLRVNSELGLDYFIHMQLAGDFAYAGRDWVCEKVLSILGAEELDSVHNHHNYAWSEDHDGQALWVVRKGATPAFPGQRGFIGGSMGDVCVIVQGLEHPRTELLASTVHGAGRVMSRTAAAGKVKKRRVWACGMRGCDGSMPHYLLKQGDPNPRCPLCGAKTHRHEMEEVVRKGCIDWEQVQSQLSTDGLVLRGAGADEAPGCYKPLRSVLAAHAGTIEVLHWLHPIGVAMAGKDVMDPFKD
jgi:tRNA-splicing ligase RtcB